MIAIRDAFGAILAEIGEKNKDIVVLDADVSSSSKSCIFAKKFPDRFFNVGIAEANMFSMAAGMATKGKIPFANAFAAFAVLRGADPIRSLIAYQNLNVKICSTYAGMSPCYDGASHHALGDISFARTLPNMTVVVPADPVETKFAVEAITAYNGPVYLRLSRAPSPEVFGADHRFEIGKAVKMTDGGDVAIIATGYMVYKSLEAAKLLKNHGVNATVVNMHTIKPLDKDIILECARNANTIVTVEEHTIYGGLGSAVAEVLAENACPVRLKSIGVNDIFAESGDYEELLVKYGLSIQNIRDTVLQLV